MSKAHPPELKKFMDKKLSLKLNGGRHVVGILRGFDPFMNLVVDETVEERKDGSKNNIGMVLFGGLLIGVGLYAFVDKWQATGLVKVETVYDVILNISLVMVIAGGVIFIVSFAGCVGALRENTCLLKFYSLCLLIFFLLEMAIAIMGFVFPHAMQSVLEEQFTDKIIHTYREDVDLQNLIDFVQQEFRCCGLSSEGYMDWSKNEYFNCSSPSVERCGVPFSCCMNATDISSGLINIMCGYGAQELPVAEAAKKVWTSGCIEIVRSWAERNLYTIAGVALGTALSQVKGWETPLLGLLERANLNHWIGLVTAVSFVRDPVGHWIALLCPLFQFLFFCAVKLQQKGSSLQFNGPDILYPKHMKNLNPDSKLKYKAFLMNVAKVQATDQTVAAERESDTDLVRPGPSTPTPRRPHADPPGRLSGDMQKHTLMKIVKSEHSKVKHTSRQCRVCTVHRKRSMTAYIFKFCVMPLHKGECFQKYHTLKHF
ncbi:hypothetical protein B7P43_G04623 [Cryptotermes secundus]|uniref:Tetraspanin-33 n=1 Tax=Cryptotermes secundus TaxID=105785 RepID=A0A2J7PI72_9NEOP|nr:hypothetical protein B7P43_G04623 [Cryptotermes secundus]